MLKNFNLSLSIWGKPFFTKGGIRF